MEIKRIGSRPSAVPTIQLSNRFSGCRSASGPVEEIRTGVVDLVCARREALAWSGFLYGNDAYSYARETGGQRDCVDGTGQR
jgi:hypothetical protein